MLSKLVFFIMKTTIQYEGKHHGHCENVALQNCRIFLRKDNCFNNAKLSVISGTLCERLFPFMNQIFVIFIYPGVVERAI